jgi:hypothetical protein
LGLIIEKPAKVQAFPDILAKQRNSPWKRCTIAGIHLLPLKIPKIDAPLQQPIYST